MNRAILYQENMEARFSELSDFPLHYPAVDHIRRGYRMSVYGSHSIYYQVEGNQIIIARILGKQDPIGIFLA